MKKCYVFDACAFIALFKKEIGYENVLSLADSLALAETKINNASLLTADHHEFDIVEQKENISFCWLR